MIKLILGLFSIILVGLSGYYGNKIPFSEQWVLYEALRATASIIFAVAGVWLAIVYPDRLKSPFDNITTSPVYKKGFSQLFSPVVHSVIVICIVLLIGIIVPILKNIDFFQSHVLLLRRISFAILSSLTLFQTYTVLSILPTTLNIERKNEQDMHTANIVQSYKRTKEE